MSDKKPISKAVLTHLTAPERFKTQTALAGALGITPQTICEKQDSDNPLTYIQMRRLIEVAPEFGFQVTPDDFFPDLTGRAA